MCTQQRLSLVSVFAVHEDSLDPKLPIECTARTLNRLGGCPGWSESSLGAHTILLVLSCFGSFFSMCDSRKRSLFRMWPATQLAFYVNLYRAVIGPSATLTGRWRPDIDLRRMLTGYEPDESEYSYSLIRTLVSLNVGKRSFSQYKRVNLTWCFKHWKFLSCRHRWLSRTCVWLVIRRSRVQYPPDSATFFLGDWSWNTFYGHSLPSADSRRAAAQVLINCLEH